MNTNTPHYVYRHYARNGDLLYIGTTNNLRIRAGQHKIRSCWFKYVFEIKHKKFPNREDALLAEKRLIKKHQPPYNNDVHSAKGRIEVDEEVIHMRITTKQFRFVRSLSTSDDWHMWDTFNDIFKQAIDLKMKEK